MWGDFDLTRRVVQFIQMIPSSSERKTTATAVIIKLTKAQYWLDSKASLPKMP